MITKSAILGVLLVGLIIGAYLYLTADPGPDEEITVEWEVMSVESGYTPLGLPYYTVGARMTVTSNVSKTIHIDSVPKLVQDYGGCITEFTAGFKPTEWPSGSRLGFRDLTYSYTSGFGTIQGDYHFELSDSMKRAGNYTLIVR